ncbi:hypothetical protein [Streptomyces sp. NPDC005953]|uniref:hypothetical protein n=1 Tax=Streptomyces sp. NPDC005953 TaxID=3156719 RepID=UPI0033E4D3C1
MRSYTSSTARHRPYGGQQVLRRGSGLQGPDIARTSRRGLPPAAGDHRTAAVPHGRALPPAPHPTPCAAATATELNGADRAPVPDCAPPRRARHHGLPVLAYESPLLPRSARVAPTELRRSPSPFRPVGRSTHGGIR